MADETAGITDEILRVERAYHEAGHAIAAHQLGLEVEAITIESDGSFNTEIFEAYTHVKRDQEALINDPAGVLRQGTIIALPGAVGESFVGRQTPVLGQTGPFSHLQMAVAYCRVIGERDGVDPTELLERLATEAEELINSEEAWEAFLSVANELCDQGRLDRDEFLRLVGEHGL